MVRLKKIQSQDKVATFNVGVQINNTNEEQAEISINMLGRLKVITIEFEHKTGLHLFLKDTIVVNNQRSNDIVKLQYNCINGIDLFIIRFGTAQDKENFLLSGFADRMRDSGESSSDSMSTPSPPHEPQVEQ